MLLYVFFYLLIDIFTACKISVDEKVSVSFFFPKRVDFFFFFFTKQRARVISLIARSPGSTQENCYLSH